MAWGFSAEPEFQEKLDWIREFIDTEVKPLDVVLAQEEIYRNKSHPAHEHVLRPLQEKVKAKGLWACHLDPALGGQGYGQLKLALMNEIIGRSVWAPWTFGSQAPDSGNAEIIAHYGTQEQKDEYLMPLLEGKINSTFSMTEPQSGSDPREFTCTAVRDGDEWVINGEKYFSSNLRYCKFAIVMVITSPDAPIKNAASMFLVPKDTPGVNIIRNVRLGPETAVEGSHAYVRYDNVRVPADALLGGEGNGFVIAQTRLGGGRLHHAMRTIGVIQRCLDMMCERALSRRSHGELLSQKQMVQDVLATSWIEIQQFRLQVLYAAWTVDQVGGHNARKEIAGVKIATAKIFQDVVVRAMRLHGGLGLSNEMPFFDMLQVALAMGIADGASEVHKVTIARLILREYEPQEGLWPRDHRPSQLEKMRESHPHLFEYAEMDLPS